MRKESSDSPPEAAGSTAGQKSAGVTAGAFLNGDSLYILNYNTQYVEITTQSSVTHLFVGSRLDKES
ncbi:hypothetical protein GCM10007423_43910 [Dyadobacter endophyticus]|uniref:Uncharacterized protein n=1 Tax=Dyadobacter endophyticus TaxID=1749036 RepID=A0ABQ1Z2D4_9BACT|nr:hypothetical protein GCM10007423_43910 [Dyadobacter endophyticus]